MAMNETGGIRESRQAEQLRNTLSGAPVQRSREDQTREAAPSTEPSRDQARVRGAQEVALRETNRAFEAVQSRAVAAEMEAEGLTEMRREIDQLRAGLRESPDEPVRPDEIRQAVDRIDRLTEDVRFDDVPLLRDFSSEALGLEQIAPETERREADRILQNAADRIGDRQAEVRQEEEADRREMDRLNVAMENLNAAISSDRLENQRDLDQAVERVRNELQRRPEPGGNLTADRVMELI